MITKVQAVVDAAAALQAAASELGLGQLSPDALSMLLGQAMGESMFGRQIDGYGSDMAGTNNWGSVQATAKWQAAHQGQDGFGKFAHTDYGQLSGGWGPYVGWYRIYPNQLEGAKGFLNTVLYGGAAALFAAVESGPNAYAAYLKDYGYYEAPVEQYQAMLQSEQYAMSQALAAGANLTPASPTADLGEPIAPVEKRVIASLLPVTPQNGIVMFGTMPAWPAGMLFPSALLVGGLGYLTRSLWWPFWEIAKRKAGL